MVVFDVVVSMNDGSMVNTGFREILDKNNEKMRYNVPLNEVKSSFPSRFLSSLPFTSTFSASFTMRPSTSNEITKPINDDVKEKMTIASSDNGYQSMKRAVDTLDITISSLNEKMERYMNFYDSDMLFLTTKLNNLKEKLNTLEILNHNIDQLVNRPNTAQQKLQIIQEAIFGSQSINGKLDRLEVSVQQLHARIDELQQEQTKFNTQISEMKQNKKQKDEPSTDSDEHFRNVESKIEQLVEFVHSFAELNRLESSDILNRLENMQSQLIQFFDAKEMIASNQRNANDTIKQGMENLDEIVQFSNGVNATDATKTPKDSIKFSSSDVTTEQADSQRNISTEMPSTLLNLNDDRRLFTSNAKSIRKRKRMTTMVS